MAKPVTNHQLETLLAEAGFDGAHGMFARHVNVVCRPQVRQYDAASVYWWLRGRTADADTQTAMARVLHARLHREVTVDDLGFATAVDYLTGLRYPAAQSQAVTTAEKAWRLAACHPDLLGKTSFDTAAAVETALAWRYETPDAGLASTGTGKVTAADVQALRLATREFVELDQRHGGTSHSRKLIADILHRRVGPMLHGTYTDMVGEQLVGTAAMITGQLAYMLYDSGEHGGGQRLFTVALRLAKAGNDRLLGAHLLANIATQAIYLGHGREAVRLARAAVDGAGRAPAAVRARLHTTEACAHAVTGDRVACTVALRQAARALGRSRTGTGPDWAGYFTSAHLAGAAMRCYRDLRLFKPALRLATEALELAPTNVRTRALHTALLATTYAEAGRLDEACEYGDVAAEQITDLVSRRVRRRMAELVSVLNPHRSYVRVAEFLDRHASLTAS